MLIEPITVVSSSAFLLPQKLFLRGESSSISRRRSLADWLESDEPPVAFEAALERRAFGAVKNPAMLPAKAPASWTKRPITAKRVRPPSIADK